MFKIDHEKWIDVPFWTAWLFAITLFNFFSLFIIAILAELNTPLAILTVMWVGWTFVLSFIYTVLTRRAHAHWLENRKREMEKLNTPNSDPESSESGVER